MIIGILLIVSGTVAWFWFGFWWGKHLTEKVWVERWKMMQRHAAYWYDLANPPPKPPLEKEDWWREERE
jgi:hypothetical protein